jgi:polyphosphate kinase
VKNKTIQYGFVSTGNLNEKTARIYGDFCLMTSNRLIMADINRVFNHLEKPTPTMAQLRLCKTLLVCPVNMRKTLHAHINREIAHAKAGKPARIIIKVNSLSDELLITHLYKAAEAGVEIKMIIRGIFCARFDAVKLTKQQQPYCISIVDEYLEHARILVFHNQGKPDVYISSADFMVRNLDHRIEAAAPVTDPEIKQELLDILEIQLSDNVKARRLDKELKNEYVKPVGKKKTKSQVEVYRYLAQKKISSPAHPRFDDRHYVILD